MIKVLFSPQRSDETITYTFTGETVAATYQSLLDEFDFAGLPDGVADSVESDLAINPIIRAERIAGVLHLTLLNFIGIDATEAERFPEWVEV